MARDSASSPLTSAFDRLRALGLLPGPAPTFDPPLLYARCWEDHEPLRAALRLQPGARALSIASAGDNSFALLLDDPAEVVMLDRNRTQLALVHLKIACLKRLEPRDARRFLGSEAAPPAERRRRFAQLRPELPTWAAEHLAQTQDAIEAGILHAGKFERYLATFRQVVLPLVQTRRTVDAMCSAPDLDTQRAIYRTRWDSRRWRLLFRAFFGRRVMQRIGRERAFFDHVTQQSIGDVFRGRAQKALCDLPVASNPYLLWILQCAELPPPYLDDAHYQTIKGRLDRLRLVEATLAEHLADAPEASYDAYNLSDCFEYLSEEATAAILGDLVKASRPGARLAYWNLLVPRDGAGVARIHSHPDEAKRLHAGDRAFFYGRFVVESVTRP